MAALDTTAAAGVLKDFYLPTVRSQIPQKTAYLEQIQRGSEHVEGEQWVLSLHVARNPGVGARREGGTSPTAGSQGYKKGTGDTHELQGRFEVTSKSMKAMAGNAGSWVRSVESQTKGLVNDCARDLNRQLFGTSNGVVATCGTTSSSTTVQLASATYKSIMRFFFVNQVIDIGTVANPTSVASARSITAVNATNKTITISGAAVTTASTDFVFVSGAGGAAGGLGQAEVTGLQSIVAESGSLFGVDPSSYPVWAATVLDNSGTPRAISDALLEEALDEADLASGEEADLIVTSYDGFREYGDYLHTLKRSPATLDLKGGHKGLEVSSGGRSAALMRERDCQDDWAYVLNTEHLFFPEMSDWEWLDDDGAVLTKVADKSNYEATLQKFCDQATDMRNAHALVKDIAIG